MTDTGEPGQLNFDPAWPDEDGPFVLLVDASSKLESRLIAEWFERVSSDVHGPVDIFRLPPSRRRRPFATVDPAIDERLHDEDDPLLVPVRVAWLAPKRDGVRRITLKDAVTVGDSRDPGRARQRDILTRHPERCRIVVGEPARRSAIGRRWMDPEGRGPADGTSFGEFVALKAWLALERSERHLRGQRYKVPRFLKEDLFWSRPFQHGIQRLALAEGRSSRRMQQRMHRYLGEIAAQHSPYVIDLVNAITSVLIRAAHQSVDYSTDELHAIMAKGDSAPLIFLPSHKSNFDHLVFQHVMFENSLPLNHTAGGINMNFFLVGPLLRRNGLFFIRRDFKDNEPYKFVLRQYLDYLLEKRFNLEWYIEGGRSRTGKLREPRLGLLAYVTESYQRGIVDDIILVPVSIQYDQITDVGSYAAEQRGLEKESESLLWALRFIMGLRRSHGSIHIRFGEPLAMSERIGRDDDLMTDEGALALPRVAFEVSTRINDVTPITTTGLVTLALLSRGDRGFTLAETIETLQPFLAYVEERGFPTTFSDGFESPAEVEATLEDLEQNGVVRRTEGLSDVVYTIGPDEHLEAAYYRNTIIHHFVTSAITELAATSALIHGVPMTEEVILDNAMALRDLLKFEFFFSGREEFADEVTTELDRFRKNTDHIGGLEDIDIDQVVPAKSPVVLRPFLEAYSVVAGALCTFEDAPVTADELADAALRMGQQLWAQGRIRNHEAVSTSLFGSCIELAENRHLLESGAEERFALSTEVTDLLDAVHTIAAARGVESASGTAAAIAEAVAAATRS